MEISYIEEEKVICVEDDADLELMISTYEDTQKKLSVLVKLPGFLAQNIFKIAEKDYFGSSLSGMSLAS